MKPKIRQCEHCHSPLKSMACRAAHRQMRDNQKWIEAVEKVTKEMIRQASEVTQDDLELTD